MENVEIKRLLLKLEAQIDGVEAYLRQLDECVEPMGEEISALIDVNMTMLTALREQVQVIENKFCIIA